MKKYLPDFILGLILPVVFFLGPLPFTGEVGLVFSPFGSVIANTCANLIIFFLVFLAFKKLRSAQIYRKPIMAFSLGIILGVLADWWALYILWG